MIKLSHNSFVSRTYPHAYDVINIESVEERLHRAFKESGYFNTDVYQDVLSTVADYVLLRGEYERLTLEKLENLIVRILTSSGLDDIAHKFSKKGEEQSLTSNDEEIINLDEVGVKQLLKRHAFFTDKPVDEISDFIVTKLSSLGLERVTGKLVIALAENLYTAVTVCSCQEGGNASKDSMAPILLPQAIRSLLDHDEEMLIARGIITIKPISLLLPVVKIQVMLSRVVNKTDQSQLFELEFYPAFDQLCARLKTIVVKLSAYLNKTKFPLTKSRDKVEILFYAGTGDPNTKKPSSLPISRPQLLELQKITTYHLDSNGLARCFFL